MPGTSPGMTAPQSERHLMDSLDPAVLPVTVTPASRPPRIWKFWGTSLWGLFVFAAMFAGQIAVVAWFVLRRGGAIGISAPAPSVGGGPAGSLSRFLGLPPRLPALWCAP